MLFNAIWCTYKTYIRHTRTAANKLETTQYGYEWERSTSFPGRFSFGQAREKALGMVLEKDDDLLGPTFIKTHCLRQNSFKSQ